MQESRSSANGGQCPRIHSCRWSCQVQSRAPAEKSVGRCPSGGTRRERTAYNTCKGELAQEQVRTFLVLADLAKGDGTWSVPTLLRSWFMVRSGFSTYATRPCHHASMARRRVKKHSTHVASMAQHGDHRHRHHALCVRALVRL